MEQQSKKDSDKELFESMVRGLNIEALENFMSSLDKEKINEMITGKVDALKKAVAEIDFQALNNLISAIKDLKKKFE